MSGDTVAAPICTDSEAVLLKLVTDVAYNAFMQGRTGKNPDDGGPCDWFTDTLPLVPGWLAKSRTLRAQPSATLGGVTAALRQIAEGNLGDAPWQANYDRIREVARAALSLQNATPDATRARETGE